MSSTWKRKRSPEDVPTPTAVAVSDYCRRSKRPAAASDVREALSALSDEDDFRVKEITDQEARVEGLGPFAVVDWILGTPVELCAQRQEVGYYDLARALLVATDQPTAPPVSAVSPGPAMAPVLTLPLRAVPAPRPVQTSPTLAEKIAPLRRSAAEVARASSPTTFSGDQTAPASSTAASRSREAPPPRGRFKQLEGTRRHLDEASSPSSAEYIQGLVAQSLHRIEIRDALTRDFSPPFGRPITLQDVDATLQAHRLLDKVLNDERAHLKKLFREHRGATGRVSWALHIHDADLAKLMKAHESDLKIDAIQDVYRKEALAPENLGARLDMLGRTKYLSDLGIRGKFERALAKDVTTLLSSVRTAEDPLSAAARKADVPRELLSRAVEKLQLTPP